MDARALFYQDSHLCRFTALVTGCHPMPDGWAVSLDRTAFYPEGGAAVPVWAWLCPYAWR